MNRDYKEIIDEHGWLIVKNVFSSDEIQAIRDQILAGEQPSSDVLSNDTANQFLFSDKITSIIKKLINVEELVYFGDSSIAINTTQKSFHKDSRDRNKPSGKEWRDTDYSLIRVGIYLQDHAIHSGGLSLRDKSHLHCETTTGKVLHMRTKPGDVVFWKLTTTHAGNADLFRFFPSISVNPKITRKLPNLFFLPSVRPRVALFMTIGKQDSFLDEYIDYLKHRTYAVERWLNTQYSESQLSLLKDLGINLVEHDVEALTTRLKNNETSNKFIQLD